MFRENEASGVSAVLEAKLAGNAEAMLDAAAKFWLLPVERIDERDQPAIDVWTALTEAELVARAAELGATLISARQKLRAHAFIDVVEALPLSRLLELATTVLATGWPAQPYLAAIFACMVDAKLTKELWAFIQANMGPLAARLDTWVLVGFAMTTTNVGDADDLKRWFDGWESREGVPMWLITARGGTIGYLYSKPSGIPLQRLVDLAAPALKQAVRDESAAYLEAIMALSAVQRGDFDQVTLLAGDRAMLLAPLARYVNASRHARPVTTKSATYVPVQASTLSGLAIAGATAGPRPTHWRIGVLIDEIGRFLDAALAVVPLVCELAKIPPGDPRAIELWTSIRKASPARTPWIRPTWERLVRERVGWWARFRGNFF